MSDAVTYRQIAATLRVQRGAGREDLVSERPVVLTAKGEKKRDARGNVTYLDSDEAPTLVTFDEHCQINVPFLLKTGALVEIAAPTPSETAKVEIRRRAGKERRR